jgi:hypothetical protein
MFFFNKFLFTKVAWKRFLFGNRAAYCIYFKFLSVFALFLYIFLCYVQ